MAIGIGYGALRFFNRRSLSQDSKKDPSLSSDLAASAHSTIKSPVMRFLKVFGSLLALAYGYGFHAEYALEHPGAALVFIGILGEGIWEAKATLGMARMFETAAAMLLLGVFIETVESFASDKLSKEMNDKIMKMEEKDRWRSITSEQKKGFLSAVAGAPKGNVVVWASTSGDDTKEFAKQVRKLLDEAGYDTKTGGGDDPKPFTSLDGQHPYDIEICLKDRTKIPDFAIPLINAMRAMKGVNVVANENTVNAELTTSSMFFRVQPKPSLKE